ncbi:MAG TPA: stage II sporulation protein M [Candidatus Pacearchaeota archaeon]|nr:stage II sporulation protein M [Candidatus Pacearchaeota archaeon]
MKSKKSVKKRENANLKKKTQDASSLKGIYQSNLKYIYQSKTFILVTFGVFVLFFLLGLLIPAPSVLEKEIFELIKELSEKIGDLQGINLIFYIFFNNLFASLFGLVLGIFFGIFSVASAITNGYVLGFVSALSVNAGGISSLWKILPHGIFELPAIFISLGLGLSLGFPFVYRYFKYYSHKKNYWALAGGILFLFAGIIISAITDKKLRSYQFKDFKRKFNNALSIFFFIIVPLLIIAAIIEGLLISLL